MRLVYVHGINQINTDPVSAKQAWDLALFGQEYSDSKLVYWGDLSVVQEVKMGLSFTDMLLCELLNFGTNNHFLKDVNNYFYDKTMRQIILERLMAAMPENRDEPCVVIGHSLGSVIAYDGLINHKNNTKTFITLGSPLGLYTVMAEMKRLNHIDPLPIPKSLERWENFRDRVDPVALTKYLHGHYKGDITPQDHWVDNIDNDTNPHSLPGYLKTRKVRNVVAEALYNG